MFVIAMLVILLLSGLVLVAVAQGEGKLEALMDDDRPAATLLTPRWRARLRALVRHRPAASDGAAFDGGTEEAADRVDEAEYAGR